MTPEIASANGITTAILGEPERARVLLEHELTLSSDDPSYVPFSPEPLIDLTREQLSAADIPFEVNRHVRVSVAAGHVVSVESGPAPQPWTAGQWQRTKDELQKRFGDIKVTDDA